MVIPTESTSAPNNTPVESSLSPDTKHGSVIDIALEDEDDDDVEESTPDVIEKEETSASAGHSSAETPSLATANVPASASSSTSTSLESAPVAVAVAVAGSTAAAADPTARENENGNGMGNDDNADNNANISLNEVEDNRRGDNGNDSTTNSNVTSSEPRQLSHQEETSGENGFHQTYANVKSDIEDENYIPPPPPKYINSRLDGLRSRLLLDPKENSAKVQTRARSSSPPQHKGTANDGAQPSSFKGYPFSRSSSRPRPSSVSSSSSSDRHHYHFTSTLSSSSILGKPLSFKSEGSSPGLEHPGVKLEDDLRERVRFEEMYVTKNPTILKKRMREQQALAAAQAEKEKAKIPSDVESGTAPKIIPLPKTLCYTVTKKGNVKIEKNPAPYLRVFQQDISTIELQGIPPSEEESSSSGDTSSSGSDSSDGESSDEEEKREDKAKVEEESDTSINLEGATKEEKLTRFRSKIKEAERILREQKTRNITWIKTGKMVDPDNKKKRKHLNPDGTKKIKKPRKHGETKEKRDKKPKHEKGKRKPATRSRTGCWICRLRKKKCTEERPACFNCLRLHLDCYYDAFKPDFVADPVLRQQKMDEIRTKTKEVKRQAMRKKPLPE